MHNWWVLIKERFSPLSYIPMILVFSWANALYLSKSANYTLNSNQFLLLALLMLSFFFRLRCFDEIKDYEHDLKHNPTRPIARGVLSQTQVKKGILFMILFELGVSSYLGFWPFVIHTLAIFYSLLMYEEFFIGEFLRPRLVSYATSHTFVSVLLGISAATALTNFNLQKLTGEDLCFFLMNWAFFNLFEFARKTFAPEEERPQVPSYSALFKPKGAWGLSWSQVLCGLSLSYFALGSSGGFYWVLLAGAVYTFMSLSYALNPQPRIAKIFRSVTGVYLLIHYILIGFVLGV